MKLSELIKNLRVKHVRGSVDVEVSDLSYNSLSVTKGCCFVALKGIKVDGHDFVQDVVARGASVAITEREFDLHCNATNVVVDDTRLALAGASANFFGNPSENFRLVGVTGTNGKTTITYLLEAIFAERGDKTGVIGTVSYRYGDVNMSAPHTTPESYDLQKMFCDMRRSGVGFCTMEVSSHALTQQRVAYAAFDAGVFTNLTPEHLDYHEDMEEYFEAKAILFEKLLKEGGKDQSFAVINGDDPYGRRLIEKSPVPTIVYGFENMADVRGLGLSFNEKGLTLKVESFGKNFEINSQLCGRFNAYNILAAVAVAMRMGVSAQTVKSALAKIKAIPGRFEAIPNNRGVLALVDYAHTPDALINVLTNARELAGSKRLLVVFGCGGDRDRKKRPLMGEAAAKLSDIVIVTSDNPRTEDADAIVGEILPGVKKHCVPLKDGKGFVVMPDRRSAIEFAVRLTNQGDVLVVAGKGHENYQIIGTKKIHFDDKEILQQCFEK